MTSSGATRVGVVGLGAMGGAMSATLLSRGFAVVGFDVDPTRLEQLEQLGGTSAASAADVARAVDFVILSLPSVAAFEAACLGTGGVREGAHGRLIVIETSTLPLAAKVAARDALAGSGATLLDCPLSGTGDQAARGDLVVFASGDAASVRRCTAVFEGFSRSHHYLGEFGAGSNMKLVANLLVAIHNVAAAEALRLAERFGLDVSQTLEVIADSAATSRMFEVRAPKMVARNYAPGIRASVFQKDLALIEEAARSCGATTRLFDASTAVYEQLDSAGFGGQDTASVYEVLERTRP